VISKTNDQLQEGSLIDYELKLHGIPLKWRSKILEWHSGDRFVDLQVRGPYRHWYHRHDFIPMGKGTLMRDHVTYELPGPFLSDMLFHPWVGKDLDRIFDYRRDKIQEIFGK